MRHFISIFLLCALLAPGHFFAQNNKGQLRNGDLIFIVNPGGQGKAIQLATHSKYTHIGIIFIENGQPVVYHAVEPVSKNTLEEFIKMSADGSYEIKRLKDQSLLTAANLKAMLKQANQQLGIHYDIYFGWDDSRLYCSEFVWKLYKQNLHIDLGQLKTLKEFDLNNPVVKHKLQERYGNNIPLEEHMISPGDMYESSLLE